MTGVGMVRGQGGLARAGAGGSLLLPGGGRLATLASALHLQPRNRASCTGGHVPLDPNLFLGPKTLHARVVPQGLWRADYYP